MKHASQFFLRNIVSRIVIIARTSQSDDFFSLNEEENAKLL